MKTGRNWQIWAKLPNWKCMARPSQFPEMSFIVILRGKSMAAAAAMAKNMSNVWMDKKGASIPKRHSGTTVGGWWWRVGKRDDDGGKIARSKHFTCHQSIVHMVAWTWQLYQLYRVIAEWIRCNFKHQIGLYIISRPAYIYSIIKYVSWKYLLLFFNNLLNRFILKVANKKKNIP